MSITENEQPKLALLIDADNVSAKYLPIILNEIPKYGIATYRRIYGDFTDPQMASWRPKLLDNSITPIQQFSNVKSHKKGEKAGKNATDSTLIIDAMDILYGGKVDGFVIVSSDSDFTRLASRLRESGMLVVGMGRNQTAISFRHACTNFVNIEYLHNIELKKTEDIEDADTTGASDVDTEEIETTVTLQDVSDVIGGVLHTNENRGKTTSLAQIGLSLSAKYPDFDVRNYGYTQLSKLVNDFDRFELVPASDGYNVRIADTSAASDRVAQYMILELGKREKKSMSVSSLAALVYDKFPDFNIKDTGYTQFYKFANSVRGIKIDGDEAQDGPTRLDWHREDCPTATSLPQQLLAVLPRGQELRHERMEARVVARLEQMAQLVDDHVLEALHRVERKARVDADAPRRRLARAPAALHVAIRELSRTHAHHRLPLLEQQGHGRLDERPPRTLLFLARLLRVGTRRVCQFRALCGNPASAALDQLHELGVWHAMRARDFHRTAGFDVQPDGAHVLSSRDGERDVSRRKPRRHGAFPPPGQYEQDTALYIRQRKSGRTMLQCDRRETEFHGTTEKQRLRHGADLRRRRHARELHRRRRQHSA